MTIFPKYCPVCNHSPLTIENETISCDKCKVYSKSLNLLQKVLYWARGRSGWWRALILLWFIVMLFQNWKDTWFEEYRTNPISAFDLGMHELGHILFIPFGTFMHIAGGCLFQCIFPIIGIFAFYQIRWYFASIMCLPWLGLNLFDVAAYAGDARSRLLPLTAGFAGIGEQGNDEAYDQAHDWYQILSRLHHLNWDHAIEHILRISASIIYIIGLILGILLVSYMIRHSLDKSDTEEIVDSHTEPIEFV